MYESVQSCSKLTPAPYEKQSCSNIRPHGLRSLPVQLASLVRNLNALCSHCLHIGSYLQ